jgi:hypothetical protein
MVRIDSLDDNDYVMALATCGVDSGGLPQGFGESGLSQLFAASGASVRFGPVTARSGTYRLCWCREGGGRDFVTRLSTPTNVTNAGLCRAGRDFNFDFGTLTILGPPKTAKQTCVAGQTCVVDAEATVGGSVVVLDTCGTYRSDDVLAGAMTSPVADPTLHQTWAATAPYPLSSTDRPSRTELLTAWGGQYRLCWCADGFSCTADAEFTVDAGEFFAVGPLRPALATCVSGQSCVVALDGSIDGDRLLVADTCAVRGYPQQRIVGVPSAAPPEGPGLSVWNLATTGGGQYRLCWCAAGFDCDDAALYLDRGRVDIVGPTAEFIHRTCIAGQTCVVRSVEGAYLSAADSLMVMDTCGVAAAAIFAPVGSVPTASPGTAVSSTVANAYSFATRLWTAAGGVYRLCWCAGGAGRSCAVSDDFLRDFGSLHVLGLLSVDVTRTCVSVSAAKWTRCRSGVTC